MIPFSILCKNDDTCDNNSFLWQPMEQIPMTDLDVGWGDARDRPDLLKLKGEDDTSK